LLAGRVPVAPLHGTRWTALHIQHPGSATLISRPSAHVTQDADTGRRWRSASWSELVYMHNGALTAPSQIMLICRYYICEVPRLPRQTWCQGEQAGTRGWPTHTHACPRKAHARPTLGLYRCVAHVALAVPQQQSRAPCVFASLRLLVQMVQVNSKTHVPIIK
jgi:hypothetical protein